MTQSVVDNSSPFEASLEEAFAGGDAVREAAFARFAKTGLPHRRVEGWKWSDFNAALRGAPANDASAATIPPSAFAALGPLEFRIIDGALEKPSEIIDGLEYGLVDPMATIPELESHPLVSLNVAMAKKAIGITVKEGVTLDRPILIRHIRTGNAPAFGKTLLRLYDGAAATLIETYEGPGAGYYSHLSHADLRDGATLTRFVMQAADADAVVHALFAVKVEKAVFEQTSLSTGSKLSRHETIAHFMADGARATINSAALVSDSRHSDFTSLVRHRAEDCVVRQLHKGVAADKGRNIFQGKFLVDRGAQQTDAQMTANALLLNDGAEANHKPELEIYADDVECAHGSTCGALDENALFYLRQRGLSEAQARSLLIEAFAGEVIEAIEDDAMREVFAARVASWLEARA